MATAGSCRTNVASAGCTVSRLGSSHRLLALHVPNAQGDDRGPACRVALAQRSLARRDSSPTFGRQLTALRETDACWPRTKRLLSRVRQCSGMTPEMFEGGKWLLVLE